MSYNICFSIVANMDHKSLIRTITNTLVYNPNCIIAVIRSSQDWDIHIHQLFLESNELFQLFKDRIVFNVINVDTFAGQDLRNNNTAGHVYNFVYTIKKFDFKYFIPIDTNVRFYKFGLFEYLQQFEYGNGENTFEAKDLKFWPSFSDWGFDKYGWEPYQGVFFTTQCLVNIWSKLLEVPDKPNLDANIFFNTIQFKKPKGQKFVYKMDDFVFEKYSKGLNKKDVQKLENGIYNLDHVKSRRWSNVIPENIDFENIYAVDKLDHDGAKYIWERTLKTLQLKVDFVF